MKSEEMYLKAYASTGRTGCLLQFYDAARPRQALGYRTPTAVFHKDSAPQDEAVNCTEVENTPSVGIIGREPAVFDANAPVFGLGFSQLNRRNPCAGPGGGPGQGLQRPPGRLGMAQDMAATRADLPALMTAGRWKSSRMPARFTER